MTDLVLPAIPVWWWIAAALVAILGAARLTRLVTHDDFPPMVAIRIWWTRINLQRTSDGARTTLEGPWTRLVTCHWCFGPWAFALAIGTAWLTGLHWGWWLFWGWLAGSYLTSMVVERDEKD